MSVRCGGEVRGKGFRQRTRGVRLWRAAGRGEAVRDRGRLEPVRRVELAQDVRDVDAGGLDADHERRRRSRGWCGRARRASAPPPRAASARGAPRGPPSRRATRVRRREIEPRALGEQLELAQQRLRSDPGGDGVRLPERRARLGAGARRRRRAPRPGASGSRPRAAGARAAPTASAASGPQLGPRDAAGALVLGLGQGEPAGGVRRDRRRPRRRRGARRRAAPRASEPVARRRRRRGGRGRAPPAPPVRAAPWRRARRGSGRPSRGRARARPSRTAVVGVRPAALPQGELGDVAVVGRQAAGPRAPWRARRRGARARRRSRRGRSRGRRG